MADASGACSGTFYTDGSRIHNGHCDTRRLGWSFVVVNSNGTPVAIARGVPPSFIHDIPGAEAWALAQATRVALAGSQFRWNCKPALT